MTFIEIGLAIGFALLTLLSVGLVIATLPGVWLLALTALIVEAIWPGVLGWWVVGGAIGAKAIAELERFHFDLCLIGACGLDIEAGLTCFHYDDALFKREVALHARRVITAVTADKLETRAPCSVIALEALDGLVLGPGIAPESRAALLQAGVNLIETTDGIAAR